MEAHRTTDGTGPSDRHGRPAAQFELADSEGRTYRMEDFAGAWLLLVFHRHLG